MKKTTWFERITCILFSVFIGIMGILYVLLPAADFSETEKRQLATFPTLTWETLTSGEFGTELETYMADHIPGRNFFVGLGAYYDLYTGRQPSKDVYVAKHDRIVEAPTLYNPAQWEKNMKYINRFAANLEVPVDLILVPSAGYILEDSILGIHKEYRDKEIIDTVYSLAGDNIRTMDLLALYRNEGNQNALYYRTDHHWTSYGAFQAYRAYMQCLGRDYREQDFFTVETYDGFRGSTYSRSALWLTPGETLELWHGSDLSVTIGENRYDSPFFMDRLEEADMYTVFLNGNQPIVRIHNPNGEGKILVIRDSYSNCLGPFLAESYAEVVMVDLRYYKMNYSAMVAQEGFDNVLILYSIGNFMTDENIPHLK